MTAVADKNAKTGLRLALVALAMVALAFASVPLYRAFCQATGFGGTTQRAETAPGAVALALADFRFEVRGHVVYSVHRLTEPRAPARRSSW